MPSQKPGKSKQDYSTPIEFIKAVVNRFGPLTIDLAATRSNSKADLFISPEEDSLKVDWGKAIGTGLAWLNPPFSRISDWAKRCATFGESGSRILFLTPYTTADWNNRYVYPHAIVIGLVGRLSFDGNAPYPKDCQLAVYGTGLKRGYELWDWRSGVSV